MAGREASGKTGLLEAASPVEIEMSSTSEERPGQLSPSRQSPSRSRRDLYSQGSTNHHTNWGGQRNVEQLLDTTEGKYCLFECIGLANKNDAFKRNIKLALRGSLYMCIMATPFLLVPLAKDTSSDTWLKDILSNGKNAYTMYAWTFYTSVGMTISFAKEGILGTFLSVVGYVGLYMYDINGVTKSEATDELGTVLYGWFFGITFVFFGLWLNLGGTTKVFCLTNFVYFWMDYLNSTKASEYVHFAKSTAVKTLVTATIGSLTAVLASMIPYPFLATDDACTTAKDLGQVLTSAWTASCRIFEGGEFDHTELTIIENDVKRVEVMVARMNGYIAAAECECFGFGRAGVRSEIRKKLTVMSDIFKELRSRLKNVVYSLQHEDFGDSHSEFVGSFEDRDSITAVSYKLVGLTNALMAYCIHASCSGMVPKDGDHSASSMLQMVKHVRLGIADVSRCFLQKRRQFPQDSIPELVNEHAFVVHLNAYGRVIADFAEQLIKDTLENAAGQSGLDRIAGLKDVAPRFGIDDAMLSHWLQPTNSLDQQYQEVVHLYELDADDEATPSMVENLRCEDNQNWRFLSLKAVTVSFAGLVDFSTMQTSENRNYLIRGFWQIFIGFLVGMFYIDPNHRFDAYIACTNAILIKKFSGSAMRGNLIRLQGVVLGYVIGNLLNAVTEHQIFDKCYWSGTLACYVFIFSLTFPAMYMYFSGGEYAGMALLVLVYGSTTMLNEFDCTEEHSEISLARQDEQDKAKSFKVNAIVVSLLIMVAVDAALPEKRRRKDESGHFAWQECGRASSKAIDALKVLWFDRTPDEDETEDDTVGYMHHMVRHMLDHRELRSRPTTGGFEKWIALSNDLNNEALTEPRYWRVGWKHDLAKDVLTASLNIYCALSAAEYVFAFRGQKGHKKHPAMLQLTRPGGRKTARPETWGQDKGKHQFSEMQRIVEVKFRTVEKLLLIFECEDMSWDDLRAIKRDAQLYQHKMTEELAEHHTKQRYLQEAFEDVSRAVLLEVHKEFGDVYLSRVGDLTNLNLEHEVVAKTCVVVQSLLVVLDELVGLHTRVRTEGVF